MKKRNLARKNDVKETMDILKNLDEKSLFLVLGGAKMLNARQELERTQATV